MVPLRVGVLGPVTVWRDGREHAAGQPRQLAVLGVLATRANRVVSRGELIDAVWGETAPASAEGGVYTYVAGLRRVLEPERPRRDPDQARRAPSRVLISGGGGYLLRLGPGALDAEHFERCLGTARGLRAVGDLGDAMRAVDDALALWRGLPYAGVPGPFAEAERARLAELRTTALEERADLLLARGQAAAAVPELTALGASHPLRERTTGLLMIALYRCGRQAESLRVFGETRRRLADELGVDPGTELTRIHQQLLAMDPALDGPPAEASLIPAQPSAPPEAAAVPAACPAQLPPEVAGFAGRAAELSWLDGLLPEAGPVALITGTAGVGKTALAIRFARQAASRFPDGQLYVNLRGFDPASDPVPPGAALLGFFDALGVPPRHVPVGLDAQSGLLRTLLDGKRVLLLLDNAHDADQVRPMLPGSPGSLVLVTSRSQLTGLVVADGARLLPLGVLDGGEAASLLAGRLGPARVSAEPEAVAALVGRAAGLPLALSVTCARAASRPGALLSDLAAELADARDRLDALRTGDASTDLRAVFSWSVDKLSPAAARAFRLLSLHPGPDISAPAAASLIAATLPQTRAALAELVRASLLTEDAVGRFGYHDLLRAYAGELSAATDSAAERDAALRRTLDHYLRSAHAAVARLFPGRSRLRLPPQQPGVTAEAFGTAPAGHDGAGSDGGSYDAALAWFAAEQRVLRGLLDLAVAHELDEHCWKLAWFWAPKLKRRGRMHEVLAMQRTALASADRLGDIDALAHVHYDLGHANDWLGDYPAADLHLRRALELYTELGDRPGIGQAQQGLALLLAGQDRYAEALEHAYEGLRLSRAFADSGAVASSENTVGWILAHLGRRDDALLHCRLALQLHRDAGNRTGTADTLDSIAFAYSQSGDCARAIGHYEQALVVYRQIGDTQGEALSRLNLGDAQLANGLPDAARRSWERALALLADIPGADVGAASGRLAGLTASQGSGPAGPAGPAGPGEGLQRSTERDLNDAVKLLSAVSYVSCVEEVLTLDTLKRALLLENIHPDATARLTKAGYQVATLPRALGEDELIESLPGVSLLGIRSQTQVTDRVLASADGLLAVGAFCIGTNQVDLAAAATRGVAVFNAPFSNTRSVVELAIAEIISLARRLPAKNVKMHAGIWDKSAKGAHEVRGRKLGIVGYGNIGTQLSVIAESLGMSVYFYDVADRLAMGNARRCSSLQELLESVETVTLHVDGRPGNHGFFGDEEFSLMNPRSIFLNLSRGFVVDHASLRRHIESGHIAGAAIDVFPKEPKANGEEFVSELRGLENVILTPHIGGSTEEAQQDIGEFVSGKLVDFAAGGATAMSVNMPQVALPTVPGTHRLVHLHKNVPGVLASINRVLADHGVNVEGQLLRTRDELGYVITDIGTTYTDEVLDELRGMDVTIRLRTIESQ